MRHRYDLLEHYSCRQHHCRGEERGELVGYDGHKKRKGTKVHAAVSGEGLPLSIVIGLGSEHDSKRFVDALDGIWVKVGRGRPRTRPKEVVADSAYDAKRIRLFLKGRGIKASIAENRRKTKRAKRGKLNRFNTKGYSVGRSCVERFFGWLKGGFRRLIIRYERLASTFRGFLHLACIAILLRSMRWVSTSDLGRRS
ncbi:MAG: IS5 family transposase [archaeon]|nr:IS5 family transposase [archaeon]MCP8321343.1 IS5 family transposase [archaeon]